MYKDSSQHEIFIEDISVPHRKGISHEMTESEPKEKPNRMPAPSSTSPFPVSVWWYEVSRRFLHPDFIYYPGKTDTEGQAWGLPHYFIYVKATPGGPLGFWNRRFFSSSLLLWPGPCNCGFNTTFYDSFHERLFSLGALKTLRVVLETGNSKGIFLHAVKQSHCQ